MTKLGKVATCLKIEEIDKKLDRGPYMRFTRYGDEDNDAPGCWSYVGKKGTGEQVTLTSDKFTKNIFYRYFYSSGCQPVS